MKRFYSRKTTARSLCTLFLCTLLFTACDKDDAVAKPEEPATSDTVFYKKIRIQNFTATTTDNATTAPPAVYFSLETKAGVPVDYAKTARWDVAFSGLYNSFLSGNNGTNGANYGYGASGKGGILVLEKAFDDVTTVPADAQFLTGKEIVGTDEAGDFGVGTGWYLYDFDGTRVRNNDYDNQHIAYALADTLALNNGTKIKPRTIVVRTAKGNYAKIKMISCYKDLLSPAQWSRNAPHMYFTFEYVIVPAGSTKFEIK